MRADAPRLSHIPRLRAIWQEAFGDTDAFLDTFFSIAFSPSRARCAIEEDLPVAALYWFDCYLGEHRLAYLYAVATGKAYRGRGICHRLMEDTHRHLAALGYAGAILVPGGPSLFDFYRGMGYTPFGGIRRWEVSASNEPLPLRELTSAEYTALRREQLPPGGVLQEDVSIAFLGTRARFFEGRGVLLSAIREGDMLLVPELLGDLALAPRVTAALGCGRGSFRSVGSESFAMYLPLFEKNPPTPGYFGLAFDL